MTVLCDTPVEVERRLGFHRFFNGSVSITGLELGSAGENIMGFRKLLWLGTVSGLAVACTAAPAFADDQAAGSAPEEIVVSGFKMSLQNSMNTKREADGVVEAVSAEDIGQLPDKNVADALQRLPGITTITSAAAGSGGFGENDRVSIRGTAPSLTLTLIDGHTVATGDWFILDQLSAASRSVSYSLFPSEIVDHAVVYKSSEADMEEGGAAGTIDISTRTPLGFKDQYTATASIGGAYSELAAKAGVQSNALVNWKNDANTFGVMVQAYYEDRPFRRDGQEILGYTAIPDAAPWPTALQGKLVPGIVNNAYFVQDRKKSGGDVAVEWSPSSKLDVKVNAFYTLMQAGNYNQGDLVDVNDFINKGIVPSAYTTSNGIVTSASFPGSSGIGNPGINDIDRPSAKSSSGYVNADATYKVTEAGSLHVQGGYTHGTGFTDQFALGTTSGTGAGFAYQMNGNNPLSISFPGAVGLNNPANYTPSAGDGNQEWISYEQFAQVDSESYGQADFSYNLDNPLISQVKTGIRISSHNRHESFDEDYGCYSAYCTTQSLASISNGSFPSNFGSGAGFSTPFTLSVSEAGLQSMVNSFIESSGRPGSARVYPGALFDITEDNYAGYVMARIGGENWHGNVGVRVVNTNENINTYDSNPLTPAAVLVTGSDFGNYYINNHKQNYNDVLPSLSLEYDVSKDVIARFSAAETLTRPDYYALAGPASLNDSVLSGSQGNPALKATTSTNFDGSIEWYYAPQASLNLALFDMQMKNTLDAGTAQETFVNLQKTQNTNNPCGLACPIYSVYTMTLPTNNNGESQGVELSWQQPLLYGTGVVVNYTYADSSQDAPTPGIGGRQLLGASKHTGNLTGYYENDWVNAHLSYTVHSSIYEGIDRATKYFEDTGGLSIDALNITDATEKYYALADGQHLPRATYDYGRTFFFSLNAKL
jgi:iron complex outermembrane receptor protein